MNMGAETTDNKPIGNGSPALKDLAVRQAINYAIDRKTLVDKVYGGYAQPATTIIPSLYADQHWDPGPLTFNFNLAKANQILDAAGYTKGSDGIRRLPGHQQAVGPAAVRPEQLRDQPAGGAVRRGLAQADRHPGQPQDRVGGHAHRRTSAQGTYDLFEWGWVDVPDPNYQLSVLTCDNRSYTDSGSVYPGLSDAFYCTKEYDDLFQKQGEAVDPAKRIEIEKQMQKLHLPLGGPTPRPSTTTTTRPTARTGGPTSGPSRRPARTPNNASTKPGVLLFQNGTYSYSSIIPLSADNAPQGPSVAHGRWCRRRAGAALGCSASE